MRISRLASATGGLLLVGALAACGSSNSTGSSTQPATGPVGGPGLVASWSLTAAAIDSSDLSKFGITLTFTDTQASGFGGVNQYRTTFTSGPEADLNFAEIASTKMAGPEDAMQAETSYLAALATVTGYTVLGNELDLFAGEQGILTYTKQ